MTLSAPLMLCAAVLLTSCSAPQAPVALQPPEIPDNFATSTNQTLPLEQYKISRSLATQAQQSLATKLNQCGDQFGVNFQLSGDYLAPNNIDLAMASVWPGQLSSEAATSHGYHAGPSDPGVPVGGFYLPSLTNVQLDPFVIDQHGTVPPEPYVFYGPNIAPEPTSGKPTGVPAGGCLSSALGPHLPDDERMALRAESELINLALEHEVVQEATTRWASCMHDAGYDYAEVYEPAQSFSGQPLSSDEIQTAQADVQCIDSSKFDDVFYFVLADYQHQFIALNLDELEESAAQEEKLAHRMSE